MRALGITSFIISSLLILLFAFIAMNNGKRNPEVALIPITFLILQTWFSGYYLQKISRVTMRSEDLIVDEPEGIHLKMPRFYKISAVVLTLVILFTMVSILTVAIAAMKGYSSYGKRDSTIILTILGLSSLFMGTFNIVSAFRTYRNRTTKEA